jgi:hypothetical protein
MRSGEGARQGRKGCQSVEELADEGEGMEERGRLKLEFVGCLSHSGSAKLREKRGRQKNSPNRARGQVTHSGSRKANMVPLVLAASMVRASARSARRDMLKTSSVYSGGAEGEVSSARGRAQEQGEGERTREATTAVIVASCSLSRVD